MDKLSFDEDASQHAKNEAIGLISLADNTDTKEYKEKKFLLIAFHLLMSPDMAFLVTQKYLRN